MKDIEELFSCKINYIFNYKLWRSITFDIKPFTKKLVILTLQEAYKLHRKLELSINLSDDAELRVLNKQFLGKDRATNVLSFPSEDLVFYNDSILLNESFNLSDAQVSMDMSSALENKHSNRIYLGDVAISFDRIKDEAIEQNKSFKNHYAHMIVHAILHLMNFDHDNVANRKVMEMLEIKILNSINITNPYII